VVARLPQKDIKVMRKLPQKRLQLGMGSDVRGEGKMKGNFIVRLSPGFGKKLLMG